MEQIMENPDEWSGDDIYQDIDISEFDTPCLSQYNIIHGLLEDMKGMIEEQLSSQPLYNDANAQGDSEKSASEKLSSQTEKAVTENAGPDSTTCMSSGDEEDSIPLALLKQQNKCVSCMPILRNRPVNRKLSLQYNSPEEMTYSDSDLDSTYFPSSSEESSGDTSVNASQEEFIRNSTWTKKGKNIRGKQMPIPRSRQPLKTAQESLKMKISEQKDARKSKSVESVLNNSKGEANLKSVIMKYHQERLAVLLQGNELTLVPVMADGNCFFQSVITSVGDSISAQTLRQKICEHMLEQMDNYIGYMECNPELAVADRHEMYKQELEQLATEGQWKGKLADCLPIAVANLYKQRVRIFTSRQEMPIQDITPDLAEQPAPRRCIQLAYLAVRGCEHYDAVGSVIASRDSSHQVPMETEGTVENTTENPRTEAVVESPTVTPHKRARYRSPKKNTSRRKKKCNPQLWKKNERKQQRIHGKKYISSTGKVMPEKQLESTNCEKCRFKCQDNIKDEQRSQLFNRFYEMGTHELQRNYICQLVDEVKPVRSQGKRSTSREYNFIVENKKIRVCKDFFLKTLCIGKKTVDCALGRKLHGTFTGSDQRGRNVSGNKTPDHLTQFVHEHIQSFPTLEAHYCRKDTTKQYLSQDLNIRKMWQLYCIVCEEKKLKAVSLCVYRKIFCENYNLAFFKPKKDQCSLCCRYNSMKESGTHNADLDLSYEQHQNRKHQARLEKESDKRKSKTDKTYYSATFDLQAVLTTPCSLIGELYYTRKLCCYNLSIYSLGDAKGVCHLWDESQGKRGANEIATCLMKNTFSVCSSSKTVNEITYWSDACGGQNRNRFVAASHLYCLKKNSTLEKINHKFLESGHSQMECDSIHATIEGAKKRTAVFVPSQWHTVVSLARRSNPYLTVPLKHSDVRDFKQFTKLHCPNLKVATTGQRVSWIKVKWIQIRRSDPASIFLNYSFENSSFLEVKVQSKTRQKGRPLTGEIELTNCYSSKLPISEAKKKDLVNLCKKGIIPDDFHGYYTTLVAARSVKDRIPAPGSDESDDYDSA